MSDFETPSNSPDLGETLPRPGMASLGWPQTVPAWGVVSEIEDRQEAKRVRRARRQALLLMLGSSLLACIALYGVWVLIGQLV